MKTFCVSLFTALHNFARQGYKRDWTVRFQENGDIVIRVQARTIACSRMTSVIQVENYRKPEELAQTIVKSMVDAIWAGAPTS